MSTLSYMQFTHEDLTEFANQVKDVIANKAGINLNGYIVIVGEPKKMGMFIRNLFSKDKQSSSTIFVMKVLEKESIDETV